jgi:hypothetical protein
VAGQSPLSPIATYFAGTAALYDTTATIGLGPSVAARAQLSARWRAAPMGASFVSSSFLTRPASIVSSRAPALLVQFRPLLPSSGQPSVRLSGIEDPLVLMQRAHRSSCSTSHRQCDRGVPSNYELSFFPGSAQCESGGIQTSIGPHVHQHTGSVVQRFLRSAALCSTFCHSWHDLNTMCLT